MSKDISVECILKATLNAYIYILIKYGGVVSDQVVLNLF